MRLRSGQWIILAMFAIGLAAALGGMWYRYQTTRRALALWGADGATLIMRGPKVKLLEFRPPLSPRQAADESLLAETAGTVDAAHARGLENVRHALVEDATFDWQRSPAPVDGWSYALIFAEGERSLTVLFDPATATVTNPGTHQTAPLERASSAGLEAFAAEQFAAAAKEPAGDGP